MHEALEKYLDLVKENCSDQITEIHSWTDDSFLLINQGVSVLFKNGYAADVVMGNSRWELNPEQKDPDIMKIVVMKQGEFGLDAAYPPVFDEDIFQLPESAAEMTKRLADLPPLEGFMAKESAEKSAEERVVLQTDEKAEKPEYEYRDADHNEVMNGTEEDKAHKYLIGFVNPDDGEPYEVGCKISMDGGKDGVRKELLAFWDGFLEDNGWQRDDVRVDYAVSADSNHVGSDYENEVRNYADILQTGDDHEEEKKETAEGKDGLQAAVIRSFEMDPDGRGYQIGDPQVMKFVGEKNHHYDFEKVHVDGSYDTAVFIKNNDRFTDVKVMSDYDSQQDTVVGTIVNGQYQPIESDLYQVLPKGTQEKLAKEDSRAATVYMTPRKEPVGFSKEEIFKSLKPSDWIYVRKFNPDDEDKHVPVGCEEYQVVANEGTGRPEDVTVLFDSYAAPLSQHLGEALYEMDGTYAYDYEYNYSGTSPIMDDVPAGVLHEGHYTEFIDDKTCREWAEDQKKHFNGIYTSGDKEQLQSDFDAAFDGMIQRMNHGIDRMSFGYDTSSGTGIQWQFIYFGNERIDLEEGRAVNCPGSWRGGDNVEVLKKCYIMHFLDEEHSYPTDHGDRFVQAFPFADKDGVPKMWVRSDSDFSGIYPTRHEGYAEGMITLSEDQINRYEQAYSHVMDEFWRFYAISFTKNDVSRDEMLLRSKNGLQVSGKILDEMWLSSDVMGLPLSDEFRGTGERSKDDKAAPEPEKKDTSGFKPSESEEKGQQVSDESLITEEKSSKKNDESKLGISGKPEYEHIRMPGGLVSKPKTGKNGQFAVVKVPFADKPWGKMTVNESMVKRGKTEEASVVVSLPADRPRTVHRWNAEKHADETEKVSVKELQGIYKENWKKLDARKKSAEHVADDVKQPGAEDVKQAGE